MIERSKHPSRRLRPSRRELLAAAGLAPVAVALAPRAPRPARLWILLAGAPATFDLVGHGCAAGDPRPSSGAALEPDGFGGAARQVWVSRSAFAPCGALTDALPSLAARGARAVRGLRAPSADPAVAARAVESQLRAVLEAPDLEAVPALLAGGAREVRVTVRGDWGRLRGLAERAAQLDASLAALLQRATLESRPLELFLLGPCGRRPHARRAGFREACSEDVLFLGLGAPCAPAEAGETLLERIAALRAARVGGATLGRLG